MRKPDFERILSQDTDGAPSWFSIVLEPLNRLFEYIKESFESNISASNLKLQVIDYQFVAPFTQTRFVKTKSDKVQSVYIAQLRLSDGNPHGGNAGFDWFEENNQIVIDGIYSLGVGNRYNVRFVAMY